MVGLQYILEEFRIAKSLNRQSGMLLYCCGGGYREDNLYVILYIT